MKFLHGEEGSMVAVAYCRVGDVVVLELLEGHGALRGGVSEGDCSVGVLLLFGWDFDFVSVGVGGGVAGLFRDKRFETVGVDSLPAFISFFSGCGCCGFTVGVVGCMFGGCRGRDDLADELWELGGSLDEVNCMIVVDFDFTGSGCWVVI